jgi:serine protease inhibitor
MRLQRLNALKRWLSKQPPMRIAGFAALVLNGFLLISPVGATDMSNPAARFNNFGFNLVQSLETPEKRNLLISPASIEIAIGMAYAGATGETAEAIGHTLGVDSGSREAALQDLAALQKTLEEPEQDTTLKVANAVWVDKPIQLKDEYSLDLAKTFQTKLESLPFTDPGTITRINEWVSQATEGKISRLLEGPPSPPMFLANAVYFRASWRSPFQSRATSDQLFHLADGSTSKVRMMRQNGSFRYAKTPGYEVVALPYRGDRFAMYCFLPDRGVGELVTKTLAGTSWSALSGTLNLTQGSVALPKFTIEYGESLNRALSKLGMGIAFDPQRAQFGRMIGDSHQLFIGAVFHKSFLEVDEEGSTAAAATSVQMAATAILRPRIDFNLVFDRPFLAAIVDEKSGAILFLAIIGDPKK